MHKERLLTLADLIEQQDHADPDDDFGFSMNRFQHPCGTPSCIAGFGAQLAKQEGFVPTKNDIAYPDVYNIAAEWLGLDCDQSHILFMGTWGLKLSSVTPKQAAATLRHLADTGEVKW